MRGVRVAYTARPSMQELAESGPDPVRTIGPAHFARQEWLASAFCEPLSKCEGRPPHAGANAIQTQQRKIAHAAALSRPALRSSSAMAPVVVSLGPGSLRADPEHRAIASSSSASSSIMADTRREANVAEFEALLSHRVVEMRSSFAMAALHGSRAARPWRWWRCYCLMEAGASLRAVISGSACERHGMHMAGSDLGVAGRGARRARWAPRFSR